MNNQYYDMDSYQSGGNGPKRPRRKENNGEFLFGLGVGAMAMLLIASIAVFVAWGAGVFKSKTSNASRDYEEADVGPHASASGNFMTDDMVKKIDKLVTTIRSEYFLEEVSDEDLETGLYKGLMAALGDPYSEYYTPEEYMDLMQGSEGIYYGIGAYVSMDSELNMPKISGVFKNSPALEAGLRANDLIYKVGDEYMSGKTLSEVVSYIRGEENTTVDVTIIRDGEEMVVTVTRRRVEAPTVESEMLEDNMGYLQITEFDDVTTNQFKNAMAELNAAGMKGLILDLRANPGGNLATVVEIAQELLPEGTIVYTETKEGKRKTYTCDGKKEIKIPMVVLVDGNSASASEILAGAIQDYKKGTLVGKTTFGKGIVQTVRSISRDGSAIKLTVSGYFTPKGRNIHKIGIEPDVECEFDSELYYNSENPIDTQLEKAKEVLADLMK